MRAIGVDLVDVSRMRQAILRWGEGFLRRVFTPREIAFCESSPAKYERYAARFAAKEAVVKALGTGFRRGVFCTQVEIVDNEHSPPHVELSGKARDLAGTADILLSLSHERATAVAVVFMERRK
jgi:holo-[acyl-carrier protein] synthase